MNFFTLVFLWFVECRQQLRSMEITSRYKILHTLNLDCCCITSRETCKNQRPRCDIAGPHATHHLYHNFSKCEIV